ncbi:hypothetical protein Tco_1266691 [Tanacetum coccineum]
MFLSQRISIVWEILVVLIWVVVILTRTHVDMCQLGDGGTFKGFVLYSMIPRAPHFLLLNANFAPTLSCSSAEAKYRGVANAVAKTCWISVRVLHVPSRFRMRISSLRLPSIFNEFSCQFECSCTPLQLWRSV